MRLFILVACFSICLVAAQPDCPAVDQRVDCYPEDGPTQEKCEARGCCYEKSRMPLPNQPSCFFPANYEGYHIANLQVYPTDVNAMFTRRTPSPYPGDVSLLRVQADFLSNEVLRVKITDFFEDRYEPAYPTITEPTSDHFNLKYRFETPPVDGKGGFQIFRRGGTIPLFDSVNVNGPLIYADQFLQMSTKINGRLYGLGEHRTNLTIEPGWKRFTLFNNGGAPREDANLYGSHPFYMVVAEDGTAHGVFLHNSNAMDNLISPEPSLTFRTIGGIIDLYFFTGPYPDDVIKQYINLIGKPFLPPYWSLGFHLCRYGYNSANRTREIWQRTRDLQIPYDAQWNDIDYMINRNDFTLDPVNYKELPQLVADIHSAGMRFVPIVDPGVSASEPEGSYQPYDLGLLMDIFVKHENGSVFIGKVWNPESTAFPDFTHLNIQWYWDILMRDFHEILPFDGIWIDMNEPSNFYDGTAEGCSNNKYDNPPYRTGVLGDKLSYQTLCMNAQHAAGSHYNVHNLYGIAEAEVTYKSLQWLLAKRPFVLSRSTFSGSGRFTSHWSGDDISTWYDLRKSIQELLTFNMYGVPMMGADICGFRANTTQKLCNRWFQLGAFYTFSRNHNDLGYEDQDPAMFDTETVDSIRKALLQRYTLLPYLYTLFYKAHTEGATVARPVFFEFYQDPKALDVELAFFWGSGLYVIPVVTEDAYEVTTYVPAGRWYDWYTYSVIDNKVGADVTFDAPYDTIPLLIRGGYILPTQIPATTTTLSRKNGLIFIAALDAKGSAEGSLYWDDGEIIDPIENDKYGLLNFNVAGNEFTSTVQQWKTNDTPKVEEVILLGVSSVKVVAVNGAPAQFEYLGNDGLRVYGINIPASQDISITWRGL